MAPTPHLTNSPPHTAWWFVWLKRLTTWYMRMSSPKFFGDLRAPGRIVTLHHATRPDESVELVPRRRVIETLRGFGRSLNTVDHEQEFLTVAKHYQASPGDIEQHSYVHGMGGIETATVQDIVSRRRTPSATTYIGLRKFKRPLSEWLESQALREQLCGRGRLVGGGASCEAFVEQLAVLHVFDQMFVAKMQLRWARWFAIVQMPSGIGYEADVRKAVARGLPFVVQRAGRFACVVPRLPDSSPLKRTAIERALGMPCSPADQEWAAVMYDGADAYDAIIVWARFMLDAWQGRIEAANKRTAPLLRHVLGTNVGGAARSNASDVGGAGSNNVIAMTL